MNTDELMQKYLDSVRRQKLEIHKRIIGMQKLINLLFICFYSHSEDKLVPHLLVEGRVGQGKTATLEAFAKTIAGARFSRIQFTPDLLPRDMIRVARQLPDRTFEIREGPLVANLVLADEINRAHEKTRAALLEAMGEEQITVDGVTTRLDRPFFVMATQNPIETEGVYQLGAAQLDRFMMKVHTESLSREEKLAVAASHQRPDPDLEPILTKEEVLIIRDFIRERIAVHREVREYSIRIVEALCPDSGLLNADEFYLLPEGERGYLFLERGAKVRAFLAGRTYVLPEDIDALAFPTLNHRIALRYGGDVRHWIGLASSKARKDELAEYS